MNDAARFETSPMTPVVLTKAICLFAGLQMLIRGIRQRSIKSNVSSANKPTLSEGTWRKMTICTSATLSNTPTQSSSEIVLMFVSHSPPPPPPLTEKEQKTHSRLSFKPITAFLLGISSFKIKVNMKVSWVWSALPCAAIKAYVCTTWSTHSNFYWTHL